MIYLSASLIKDVLQCSKKAYWRTNYPEDSHQTPEQEFGSILHSCIEKNWDKPIKDMVESLPDVDVINENKAFAYTCLRNFSDNFRQYCRPEDKMEERFYLPIKDNYALVGKLDRLNSQTGLVLDWKTSRTVPMRIDGDIQFIIYDWAFEKLYGSRANLVGFASLKTGNLVKYVRNRLYMDELFSILIPKVIRILETNSYAREGIYSLPVGRYSNTCKHCSFKKICLGD